jgi:nickel-dependent lactate racemase
VQRCPPHRVGDAALDRARIASALRATGLHGLARRAARVAVLVPDGTRLAGADRYLPALAEVLGEAGVSPGRVELVLATGTHPPAGEVPRAEGLPEARRHDCRDPAALVEVGRTRSGNRVLLSRAVVEADLVVLTGRITNHYFAGFSGGAKALLPGVAGLETIVRNHRRALDAEGRRDPRATNGRLGGNPVREEMEEALALLARPAFLLDTIVDDDGAVADLCLGDPAGFEAGCARADAACRHVIPRAFDVVVAGCGGAPGDASLMQALKAPCNVAPAVREGGVLVWVAACGPSRLEGFERWLSIPELPALRSAVVRDYDLFGHNAIQLRELAAARTLVLVSPLPPERVRRMGFEPAADLATALRRAEAVAGRSARCLVVENANNRHVVVHPGGAQA